MTIETMTKDASLDSLLKELPELTESLRENRETYLTDAVLLGEVPAPTFGEEERVRLALDRFRKMAWTNPKLIHSGMRLVFYLEKSVALPF